jgi:hypothetical protein
MNKAIIQGKNIDKETTDFHVREENLDSGIRVEKRG